MLDLERKSHRGCGCGPGHRHIRPGRVRHGAGELLQRHRHDVAFAAVVLAGSYVEAGDTGLHCVSAGDVVLHRPFEAHLDRFSTAGAEVLTLEIPWPFDGAPMRRVDEPDEIVRLAERDPQSAAFALLERSVAVDSPVLDWPAMLARDLLANPSLSIGNWAIEHGLHRGSLARGFRQHFGVTVAAFRASIRAHRAVQDILWSQEPLAELAASHGFADQAHMSRAVLMVTASAPGRLRRMSNNR